MSRPFDSMDPLEREARRLPFCQGCGRRKDHGNLEGLVCWDCFKGRTPGVAALKEASHFDGWLAQLPVRFDGRTGKPTA